MISRCIVVLGTGRSGTSCVAGVLYKLGVDMGAGHFQGKDKMNPRGYFEDMRWRRITQQVAGRGYSTKALDVNGISKSVRKQYAKLAKECQKKLLWGMKDPRMCFVAQHVWPLLDDVRIVAVHRDFDASVKSVARHVRKSYRGKYKITPRQIQKRWQEGMRRRLAEFEGPVYHVNYEDLVSNPVTEITKLARFCYKGLTISSNGNVKAIARWVTPELKHF